MNIMEQYGQQVISERYSQPFRTVARLIYRLPIGNPRRRSFCGIAGEIWFRLFCRPFSRIRVLPDTLLIGASKSGTSSLAAALSAHPDCLPPFFKEPRYFDSCRCKPHELAVYRAHFATSAYRWTRQLVTGRRPWVADFSPTYYDQPHAPRRVRETLGQDVRLLMIVRNPADRAYSQYKFQKGGGQEMAETFEVALDLEQERLAGEERKQLSDPSYFSEPVNRHGYVTRGMYLKYIKRWHQYFSPEQLLVVRFEDFVASPQAAVDEVCDFLGTPRHAVPTARHNISRGGHQMAPGTRARLIEVFYEPNRQLAEYLGWDRAWDE